MNDRPLMHVQFGIDLFEKGRGTIGKLEIKPGSDCRNYDLANAPPSSLVVHPVDWMMAASIRDSQNWFFDLDSVGDEFSAINMPHELASWFKAAGYNDVKNNTNVYFTKGDDAISEANRLFLAKYRVCLFINANMLEADKQTKGSVTPDHWVVMITPIKRDTGGIVSAVVFSWGDGERVIPRGGRLAESDFLKNFYGYVAAKPFFVPRALEPQRR